MVVALEVGERMTGDSERLGVSGNVGGKFGTGQNFKGRLTGV